MSKKKSIVILSIIAVLLILGTVFGTVSFDNGQLGIYDYKAFIKEIKLGLDLSGGVYAVYDAEYNEEDYADIGGIEEFYKALDGTAKSLHNLLVSKEYTESQVSVSREDRQIRVEVPDVDDPEQIFALIGRPANLEFKETKTGESGELVDEKADPLLDNDDIQSASVGQQDGKYVIMLKFSPEGADKFAEVTANLTNKFLGIFVNNEWLMSPKIETTITDGEAIISSEQGYEYEQAYNLAVSIQSGAFQVKLTVSETDVISATLGEGAIRAGLIAGGVGVLLIIIFMIARYRLLGVACAIGLLWFTLTYLFFLSVFPWVQLTLPGIAGVLLAIGMAVDANVIIFERIREESATHNKKSLRMCVKDGFKSSFSAILDGNVTTVIGAIVLAILGAAAIKGFAITLLIGIAISLISSLLVTRLALSCIMSFNDSNIKLYGLKTLEVSDGSKESNAENVLAVNNSGGKA